MLRNVFRIMLVMTLTLLLPLCAVAEEWGLDFSQPVKNPLWLALTNAAEPLPENYEPQTLAPISPKMEGVHLVTSRVVLLNETALTALYDMVAAAQAEEIELFVRQGYRSWEDEDRRYKSLVSSGEAAQAAGQSSYQTGLSVTLVGRDQRTGDLTASFDSTPEAQWLAAHAADYGFVLRYPKGKESLTLWSYEPWHYRYVGVELAQAMQANNLCLEEVRAAYDQYQTFALPEMPDATPAPEVKQDTFLVSDTQGAADAFTLTPPPAATPAPDYTPVPLDGMAALVEDAAFIMLANSSEPLPEHYAPENLAPVSPREAGVHLVTTRVMTLEDAAVQALYQMLAAANKKDLTIYVRQGYRSYADEERRYESMTASGEAAQKPGESSYQTGLSVMLVNKEYRTADVNASDFAKSKEGKWLLENCSDYGFVLRYPNGKEDLTGWKYDPSHFRYVGVALAQKMTEENICLEEFRAAYDAEYDYQLPIPATPTPIPTATPAPTPTVNPWIEYYSTGEEGPDGDYEIDLFPDL